MKLLRLNMANQYKWGINPFQDTLLDIMLRGGDIGVPKNRDAIIDIFKYILELYLINKKDIIYLDFDIENKNGYYVVIGNNFITALWLSGIIPDESLEVLKANEFNFDGFRYTFDKKNKILKTEII
jgi:hypothetical protein